MPCAHKANRSGIALIIQALKMQAMNPVIKKFELFSIHRILYFGVDK